MIEQRILTLSLFLLTAPIPAADNPLPARRAWSGDQLVPPATPLVVCDPYFSIWSPADNLTDADTVHWTGKPHRLTSLLRIDGKPFRVMGKEPAPVAALPQIQLEVLPTRTIYTFAGAGVRLTLTFMNAALPEDLELLSRPVTYVTWEVAATDGGAHEVQAYFDAAPEIAVNTPDQTVSYLGLGVPGLAALGVGTVDQPVLQKRGDDLRIDWGYLYVAGPLNDSPQARPELTASSFPAESSREHFASEGGDPLKSNPPRPARVRDDAPVLAFQLDFGKVSETPVSRWLLLAYDDLYSIQYLKQNLTPYWRRHGWEARDLLAAAAKDYPTIKRRCTAFDTELMADLRKTGGDKFARIAALAYRQCFGASKFVADANGQPMSFSKENFSNGCIGTSDVFYPMAPQFLLFGPSLAKSFLVPFMNYAASERWKFPFAPHDLGTYPLANGQRYGGGERTEDNQMPVEESGNLLLLITAVAQMEGNADFARAYWSQLTRWAEYLKARGFDPENQLCTDDFAGHLAHNVNLSAKAICALGAFAKLAEMQGEPAIARDYADTARTFAARWAKTADDGEKFRLAFNRPDTWSQKYNLVWDRILGLNLFPASVSRKEMDFYKHHQGPYGLPLDNRSAYTKLDWVLWTATLTQDRTNFEALVDPVYRFLNETPNRVPMTDWYWTDSARQRGFQARPVVGGVFLPLLYDAAAWHKWAARDQTKAANWAPIPKAPRVISVVPVAPDSKLTWRYTTQRPADAWFRPGFDDANWQEGTAGFGTRGTPGAKVGTVWNSSDIWIRRQFELPEGKWNNLHLQIHHDEDAQVYLNGVLAASLEGFTSDYETLPLSEAGKAALKPGLNFMAVHCHQTTGGQYIDVGLSELMPQ